MVACGGFTKESGVVREYEPLVIPPNYSSKELVLYDYSKLSHLAGVNVNVNVNRAAMVSGMKQAALKSKRASIVGLQHTRRASMSAINITKKKFDDPQFLAQKQRMMDQSKAVLLKSKVMLDKTKVAMAKANVRMGQAVGGASTSTKGLFSSMSEKVASIPKNYAGGNLTYNKKCYAEYV